MPEEEHGTAPAPAPIPVRATADGLSRELRASPDISRYASLAAFPPCRCGAPICPDAPLLAATEPDGASGGIRERVRETNAMRAKYRL